jgi:hypothetical protein
MRTLLLLILLVTAQPSLGGDFDYGAYKTARLADIAADLDIDPRADYWFDAAHSRYHTVATFTGNTRLVSSDVSAFIETWVKSMGHPSAYAEMFQNEIEIRQGSSTYWLPIQQQLVATFLQEVPAGAKVNLYVLLLGALDHKSVFSVSEFNAAGG